MRNENTFSVHELTPKSPTKYNVQWPESYLKVSEWADFEGGPTVRWTWEGTTHLHGKEYVTQLFATQEDCQRDLQAQVAPVTGKTKTWLLISVVGSLFVMGSLAPAFFLILALFLWAVFAGSWFFNDSEKEILPTTFKTCLKEAAILAAIVALVSGISLLVLWIIGKIAALSARRF
jgi:hypothetical protein